jgi:hypothetical protein
MGDNYLYWRKNRVLKNLAVFTHTQRERERERQREREREGGCVDFQCIEIWMRTIEHYKKIFLFVSSKTWRNIKIFQIWIFFVKVVKVVRQKQSHLKYCKNIHDIHYAFHYDCLINGTAGCNRSKIWHFTLENVYTPQQRKWSVLPAVNWQHWGLYRMIRTSCPAKSNQFYIFPYL